MKGLKIGILGIVLATLVLPQSGESQVLTPQDDDIVPDPPKHYHHNMVFPYPFLREADIMFKTRHWERIMLKEKMNHHLYYPIRDLPDRKSLYNVLLDGILTEGTIIEVYADDRFEIALTPEQVENYAADIDTTYDPDDPTNILLIDTIRVQPNNVIAYDLKSDWFFDKQRGEMKNRILGISPYVENPQTAERYNLFWVWFPDARYALATNVAYNSRNKAMQLTYDQIFHLRFFDSIITKTDNVYDRAIEDYKAGNPMEQLLEAQKIKTKLREFESDLWTY